MNLCIDVGNTTIGLGIFDNNKLVLSYVFNTDTNKTEDEFALYLDEHFPKNYISQINTIICSSVVPSLNAPIKNAMNKIFNAKFLLVSPGIKTGLSIKTENPSEVGSDLIADLVSAKEQYGYPTLIVDLGTATKILLLDKNGDFSTCVIAPGLDLSINSLVKNTALLPEISLNIPSSVLKCKNTVSAMNAGLIYGHVDLVNGIVKRYEDELGYECKKILTGGCALYLKDLLPNFTYNQHLCLEGLNIIASNPKNS